MRQWLVNPKTLCRQHLLGEHLECHYFVGSIIKGTSLKGFIDKGLVEPSKIKSRHEELVKEMLARGYKHKSELKSFKVGKLKNTGKVDSEQNLKILKEKCEKCKQLQDKYK